MTPADLQLARELREAIYALAQAARSRAALPAGALDTVNAVAAHPAPEPRLGADGTVAWHAGGEPARAALADIARDAIALLSGPLAERIGECAGDDCALLFVDTSRPGRRRWCADDACGNRQHVRDHRARQRPAAPR